VLTSLILAGGLGTRLRDEVSNVPKPMAPVNEKPFLEYLLTYLSNQGVNNFVISVGYLSDSIKSYFGTSFNGKSIKYSEEIEPLGTGGAILNSLSFFQKTEDFFLVNGDTFFMIDYRKFYTFHKQRKSDLTMAVLKDKDNSRYGKISLDKFSKISSINNQSNNLKESYINGGIYVFNKSIFQEFDKQLEKKISFEEDLMSVIFKNFKTYAYKSESDFIDIGVPEDYKIAQSFFKERKFIL